MKAPTSVKFSSILLFLAVAVIGTAAYGQFPGAGQLPLNPKSVPQFVDPLPHFAYPGARVDATAPGTPLTVEMMPLDQQALSTGTVLGSSLRQLLT